MEYKVEFLCRRDVSQTVEIALYWHPIKNIIQLSSIVAHARIKSLFMSCALHLSSDACHGYVCACLKI